MKFEDLKLGQEVEFVKDNFAKGEFDYEVVKGIVKAIFLNSMDYKCVQVHVGEGEEAKVYDVEFARLDTSDEFIQKLKETEEQAQKLKEKARDEYQAIVDGMNDKVADMYKELYS